MSKSKIVMLLVMISATACTFPLFNTNLPDDIPNTVPGTEPTWPPISGPEPSYLVGAFYYPWYQSLEFDGYWNHWDQGNRRPPMDIGSDYYPLLGAYSSADPDVIAQHFAWLREAGVGVVVSSWWGRRGFTNRVVPVMLDIAENYGLKIAFHIEPYGGRSAESLVEDIRYIYDHYGDHPAFFWTTALSKYSPDDRPKGLFYIWARVLPDMEGSTVDPEYWQTSMDTIHASERGAIVLTDQNGPEWVYGGHFDGSYNYGVLDSDQIGYKWALNIPVGSWYVPGINPGFSAVRIGQLASDVTPRRDGATYGDRWEKALNVGVAPAFVTITSFNEWHEGTQIEPAAVGMTTPGGYIYMDYDPLPPDGYLIMTREWVDKYMEWVFPETDTVRIQMATTSDWTDLYLISGAAWQRPNLISVSEEATGYGMIEGHLGLSQLLERAEAGGQVEVILEISFREDESVNPVAFEIERGGLGSTQVEVYRSVAGEWILVDTFQWGGHSAGNRNTIRFEVAREELFGEVP